MAAQKDAMIDADTMITNCGTASELAEIAVEILGYRNHLSKDSGTWTALHIAYTILRDLAITYSGAANHPYEVFDAVMQERLREKEQEQEEESLVKSEAIQVKRLHDGL